MPHRGFSTTEEALFFIRRNWAPKCAFLPSKRRFSPWNKAVLPGFTAYGPKMVFFSAKRSFFAPKSTKMEVSPHTGRALFSETAFSSPQKGVFLPQKSLLRSKKELFSPKMGLFQSKRVVLLLKEGRSHPKMEESSPKMEGCSWRIASLCSSKAAFLPQIQPFSAKIKAFLRLNLFFNAKWCIEPQKWVIGPQNRLFSTWEWFYCCFTIGFSPFNVVFSPKTGVFGLKINFSFRKWWGFVLKSTFSAPKQHLCVSKPTLHPPQWRFFIRRTRSLFFKMPQMSFLDPKFLPRNGVFHLQKAIFNPKISFPPQNSYFFQFSARNGNLFVLKTRFIALKRHFSP